MSGSSRNTRAESAYHPRRLRRDTSLTFQTRGAPHRDVRVEARRPIEQTEHLRDADDGVRADSGEVIMP